MNFFNFNFRNEDIFIMTLFLFIIILASVICYMSAQVNKKTSTQSEKQAGAAVQQKGYPLPKSGVKPEDIIKAQAEAKDKKNRQLPGGKKEAKTEVRNDPTLPKITVKQELPVSQINNQTAQPYQQDEEAKAKPKDFSTIQEPVLQQNPQDLEKLTENKGESEENSEEKKEKSLYDLFNDDSEEETEINKFASKFEDVNLDSILDTGNDLLTQIKSNMN
jgi:Na+-transporting methylmalonyl-CoA/oxaloacetate decarboxylase gamma subunit